MILAVFLVILGAGLAFWPAVVDHGAADLRLLAIALPGLAMIAAIGARWSNHPHGIKDWGDGGVIDMTTDDHGRLVWVDWSIGVARRGVIDKAAGSLRFERRLLLGLIPLGAVHRPLRDYYRVALTSEPREHKGRVVGYELALFVVDRKADRLCVLDLSVGVDKGPRDRFVDALRGKLEELIGRPGEAPARAAPPGAA